MTIVVDNMNWFWICNLLYEQACQGECWFTWKGQEWEVVGYEDNPGEDPVAIFANEEGNETFRYTYNRERKQVTRVEHIKG